MKTEVTDVKRFGARRSFDFQPQVFSDFHIFLLFVLSASDQRSYVADRTDTSRCPEEKQQNNPPRPAKHNLKGLFSLFLLQKKKE